MSENQIQELERKLLSAIAELSTKIDVLNSQMHGDGVNSGIGSRLRTLEQKTERLQELRKLNDRIEDLMQFKRDHEDFARKLTLKLIGIGAGSSGITASAFMFFS